MDQANKGQPQGGSPAKMREEFRTAQIALASSFRLAFFALRRRERSGHVTVGIGTAGLRE